MQLDLGGACVIFVPNGLVKHTLKSAAAEIHHHQQQQQQQGLVDPLVLVGERQTLIWWAREQLQGALDAIAASRTVLELLRNEASLLKVKQRSAMVVSLTVDTIDWALSKGSTDIVRGELQVRAAEHGWATQQAAGQCLAPLAPLALGLPPVVQSWDQQAGQRAGACCSRVIIWPLAGMVLVC
jgi:hypothetical protein